jgi:hypothetical protein
MENITIGQIAGAIGIVTVIAGFCTSIWHLIQIKIFDKIDSNTKRIEKLENDAVRLKSEIADSKEERLILLKAQLACLKGLKEQGCNGPVTQAIGDIENYLMKKSHD